MTDNTFASGSCLCGNVKYSTTVEPSFMGQCHCDDCRKSTGTGHISNAFFVKDSVTITGELSEYKKETDSGTMLTRSFCTNCGSSLFSENSNNNGFIGITVGTFDNNDWFKPQFIVYNKSKPKWDCMDENIPTFDAMPPA